MMHRRRLGRTGIEVSEISFGAWQLGNAEDWARMDDIIARTLVHEALDLGINLFDTAPHYASTNSERLLGEALEGRRHDAIVVSKFGHQLDGTKDFSIETFWPSLEDSLRRLRTDYLDVLLLHNPPTDIYEGTDPLWSALSAAQSQGKIRSYGMSLDLASEVKASLDNTKSEVLEVLFNVFHQDVRRAFARVRERRCGVIAKVPLDSGWLTGRFDATSTFKGVRSRWTPEQIAQRAHLITQLDWLVADGASLTHKALGYPLAYDEVSCVIPGIRTRAHLQSAIEAAPLKAEERSRLEEFWEEFTQNGANLLPW